MNDCPHCEGEGGWNEEEHHDYGDTYAVEVLWVECPYCGGEDADDALDIVADHQKESEG